MKIRRIATLLSIFFFALISLYPENKISLEGTWSYTFSGDNRSCSLTGEKIVNASGRKQSFKVAFVLAMSEYTGGSHIACYLVGEKWFDPLETGWQYNNVTLDCTEFKTKQPLSGTYYPVILLLNISDGEYHIEDYLTFSTTLYFQNTIKSETQRLVNELNNAKTQQRYWSNQISNPRGDYRHAYNMATQWNNTVSEISRKLIHLGYDLYGSNATAGQYATSQVIPEIKNSAPPPSYGYNSAPSYTPDYSSDYSNSGGSSSSSSSLKTTIVKERCKYCNGTGWDSGKQYGPNYGGNEKLKWCDVCHSYEKNHYHKSCALCNGSGYRNVLK